jgi:hypothetical protein
MVSSLPIPCAAPILISTMMELANVCPGLLKAQMMHFSRSIEMVDNGSELFGNYSPQPRPPDGRLRNGFLALAEFDNAANGGDQDGSLTSSDTVFLSLRLWQDKNHNGISEAGELRTLSEVGLTELDLNYETSRRTDQFGNRFRYRTKVKDGRNTRVGRWAWDVFLNVAQ